jgi:hypothetical protein
VIDKGDAFVVTLHGLMLVRAISLARLGYAESLVPVPFKGRFSQAVFKKRPVIRHSRLLQKKWR